MEMNLDPAEIQKAVVKQVADQFIRDTDDTYELVQNEIDRRVNKIFAERVDDLIAETVRGIVIDGFNKTYQAVDSFGKPQGEATTISKQLDSLIKGYWAEMVDEKGKPKKDNWGNKWTRAEWTMMQICANDFSDALRKEAVNITADIKDGLREKLRANVDKVLGELFHVISDADKKEGRRRG